MKTSSFGLSFIASWEGEILHVYADVVGIPTIGIGHVVLPGEDFSKGITHEQAIELLRKDVAKFEEAIEKYVKVPLNQNQYDALISLVFNVGSGVLQESRSTLAKKLNAGDYAGAADQFLLWCNAGGKRNQGLYNRRISERKLFLKPEEKHVEGTPELSPPQVNVEFDRTPVKNVEDKPLKNSNFLSDLFGLFSEIFKSLK